MRLLLVCLTCSTPLAVTGCGSAPALGPGKHEKINRQARVPNEYLVTLAPEISTSTINERFGNYGIKDLHEMEGETYLMVLANDPGPGELLDLVKDDRRFRVLQPNIINWVKRPGKTEKSKAQPLGAKVKMSE